MARYKLIDQNDNEFLVQDNTLRIGSRSFSVELDVIERSFKSGANIIGIPRQQSTTLDFVFDTNKPAEQTFRQYMNTLLFWLNKVVKIQDTVNNIETEIRLEGNDIAYDNGGFNLGTVGNNISFRQLKPYWEDIDYTIDTDSGFTSEQIVLNNNGYVETPSIITLVASGNVAKFSIRLLETGEGILVNDLEFGTLGLNTYIIDNVDGVIELNSLNRNQKIKAGTGFFNLQVGINTLEIIASDSVDIEIRFKRRYYI